MEVIESRFKLIQNVFYIKRKPNDARYLDPFLYVVANAFWIVLKEHSNTPFQELKNNNAITEVIPFSEVDDMVFPSLKKIKEKETKRYAIKMKRGDHIYIIGLAEESFFELRKIFQNTLKRRKNVSL